MNINSYLLKKWSTCVDGYAYFLRHWPDGSTYAAVQAKLREDRKNDWATWLTSHAWKAAIADPSSSIAALAQAEVDEAITATKDSPNSASGNYSTAASSGYCSKAASSGDFSKAASSGTFSTAASSGDFSKAASSGDYSTAASSGDYSNAAAQGANTIAMVAGVGGQAKAGPNGCIALCWDDGERNRIVVGYVGQEGIEADTLYRVADGKLVKVRATKDRGGA